MNHIVIMGFMGSGKTRVGRRLAEEYKLPFVDIDKKITTQMKMSISDLFDRFGEPFVRALETRELKELLESKERMVVSVGSGLPLQEQNTKYLKEMGTIVYLKANVETLKSRLSGDNSRPLLKGNNLEERITKLLAVRDPIYHSLADIEVVTGNGTFNSVIDEIEEKLEKQEKK